MDATGLLAGKLFTKEKRKEMFGSVSGKNSMKPEIYQRKTVLSNTNISCDKTNMRINLRNNTMENLSRPNMFNNGFDYTENFDGLQVLENSKIYLNFKSVSGVGGHQTRTLRETYHFINGQINILKSYSNTYFANILDGDYAHSCMEKLKFSTLNETEDIKSRIYIGDLKDYILWFNNLILK